MFLRTWLVCVCSTMLCTLCYGQTYNWYASTHLRLGGGLDPINLVDSKDSPVTSEGIERLDVHEGSSGAKYFSNQIHDSQDLLRVLKVDLNVSAHYKFFSGNASLNEFERQHFTSDSLTWYLQATTDYGRSWLKKPKLTPEAKLLVKQPDQFRNSFGTHFIVGERRAAMVTALFSINNVSQDKVESFKTAMTLAFNNPVAGGKASGDFEKFVSEALKSSTIQINIYANGGEGMKSLSDVVTNQGNLSGVMEKISHYLSEINISNAPPIEYTAQRITTIENELQFPQMPTLYEENLQEYYFNFIKCQTTLESIREILNRPAAKRCWIPTNVLAELDKSDDDYRAMKSKLLREAKELKEKKMEAEPPKVKFPDVNLPNPKITIIPSMWGVGIFGYVEGGNFNSIHLFSDEQDRYFTPLLSWDAYVKENNGRRDSIHNTLPGGTFSATTEDLYNKNNKARFDSNIGLIKRFLGTDNPDNGHRKFFLILDAMGPILWEKASLRLLDCGDGAVVVQRFPHS